MKKVCIFEFYVYLDSCIDTVKFSNLNLVRFDNGDIAYHDLVHCHSRLEAFNQIMMNAYIFDVIDFVKCIEIVDIDCLDVEFF